VYFAVSQFPAVAPMLGPVLGVRRTTLCTELAEKVLLGTAILNDVLIHSIAAKGRGNRSSTPEELFSGRLRALARASATIRLNAIAQ
jgi:hypothetical protein